MGPIVAGLWLLGSPAWSSDADPDPDEAAEAQTDIGWPTSPPRYPLRTWPWRDDTLEHASTLSPTAVLGTHRSWLGAELLVQGPALDQRVLLQGGLTARLHWDDLGIVDRGVTATAMLGAAAGLGPCGRDAPPLPLAAPTCTFSAGYLFVGYLDHAGTSQVTGQITAAVRTPHLSGRLTVDNDFLAGISQDRFRTHSMELSLHGVRRQRSAGPLASSVPVGAGIGLTLWTGEVPQEPTLVNEDGDRWYDMTGQTGNDASHGILYGAVYVDRFRIAVGWDSEGIRDNTQNWFHTHVMCDGVVPLVGEERARSGDRWSRSREGVFLEVAFNPGGGGY